jgi:hypothetical protein
MDTSRTTEKTAEEVEAVKRTIKADMPETYAAIQARAADSDIGRQAFALVTRGIKGEPNCFYAVERGHVVGTPFDIPDVTGELASLIVRFGCSFLIMWQPIKAGG